MAVSMAKDREGFTPAEALQFLLDLLKHNDNNNNPYSDYRQVVISTQDSRDTKDGGEWVACTRSTILLLLILFVGLQLSRLNIGRFGQCTNQRAGGCRQDCTPAESLPAP